MGGRRAATPAPRGGPSGPSGKRSPVEIDKHERSERKRSPAKIARRARRPGASRGRARSKARRPCSGSRAGASGQGPRVPRVVAGAAPRAARPGRLARRPLRRRWLTIACGGKAALRRHRIRQLRRSSGPRAEWSERSERPAGARRPGRRTGPTDEALARRLPRSSGPRAERLLAPQRLRSTPATRARPKRRTASVVPVRLAD